MSHFSVMVVTDSEPTEDMLSEIMQPYHEFECTGTVDKYVQSVDRTEKAKQDYIDQESTQSFADFCSGWFGLKKIPASATPDLDGEHKFGYIVVNDVGEVESVIDRTNPNKRWDYWRVGGRYRAKLQVKDGVTTAVATAPSWEWQNESQLPQGFDSACVADIDFDRMKFLAVQYRKDWANECIARCELSREEFDLGCRQQNESHSKWMALPEGQRPRGDAYRTWLTASGYSLLAKAMAGNWELPDTDGKPLDKWIAAAPPLSAFAVVKDGNWYERGRMGWWACVSDEDDQWDDKFNELVASLLPTQWITFLDCHI